MPVLTTSNVSHMLLALLSLIPGDKSIFAGFAANKAPCLLFLKKYKTPVSQCVWLVWSDEEETTKYKSDHKICTGCLFFSSITSYLFVYLAPILQMQKRPWLWDPVYYMRMNTCVRSPQNSSQPEILSSTWYTSASFRCDAPFPEN